MDLVSETLVPICVPRFTIQPCCHIKTLVASSLAPGPWKKMLPLSRTTIDSLLLPLRSHHWRSHNPGTLSHLQRSCDLTLTKMTFYCQFPLSHLTLNSTQNLLNYRIFLICVSPAQYLTQRVCAMHRDTSLCSLSILSAWDGACTK